MYKEKTFFEYFNAYKKHYEVYEEKTIEELYAEISTYAKKMSPDEQALIESAYLLGKKAHEGQIRKTGKPFFTHPLTIVCMMLQYHPDAVLVAATLLHDTIEDTPITLNDITMISADVATLVEGATKIGCGRDEDMESQLTPEQQKFETIRKILTASQKDIRILFLKIFDRLHNMVTIRGKSVESQIRIARETLNIYVPLAKRSGLRDVYHILRALCMQILEPEKWLTLETFVDRQSEYIRNELEEVEHYFTEQIWSKKILDYRTKFFSPFSVHSENYFSDTEWYALQIIVEKPTDCYAILHDIGHRCDMNCIQAGNIVDFINNPRFS